MSLTIKQNLVSKDKYSIKCPYSMKAEYITIHNTENSATAENEIKYMISNNNQVSFHYAVDDTCAIQGLPLDRNSWSCGDGANGTGNRKSINIEICYSKIGGVKFENAEKNAAKLTAQLLHERNWDISKVKRHKDWSGKDCPRLTMQKGWSSWINMVKDELKALQQPTPSTDNSNNGNVWYRVIVGSYQNRTSAENVKKRLTNEGVAGVWIDVFKKDNVNWYRVIAGSYSNKTNAEAVKKRLDSRYNGVWIGIA